MPEGADEDGFGTETHLIKLLGEEIRAGMKSCV